MTEITAGHTDTPHGSRIGEALRGRTRNRTRAQRTESRHRNYPTSIAVEEFNEREAQLEYEAYHVEAGKRFVITTILAERLCATFPLEGFRAWFVISGHPVEISRHTQIGRTMTAVVMAHIAA